MKKLILLGLIVSCSLTLQAQSKYSYRRAYKLISKFAYADAIRVYERIYDRQSSDSVSIRIATCYAKLNQPKEVVSWYSQVRNISNLRPDDYMAYGNALESLGNYQQALHWYQQYAAVVPNDSRVAFKIQGMERLQSYYQDSAMYQIALLNINSASYDFAPAFFQRGIAFVSSRRNQLSVNRKSQWDNTYFLDIYYAQSYRQGRFQLPVPFSMQINSRMHEGAMAFNKDFTRIVFTRNNYLERKQGTSEEGINKLKLYFARREKIKDNPQSSDWANIKEFPYNSDEYSVGEPAVSSDFKTLIFTADMPGGKGGTDLYISTFEQGAWTKPRNLGDDFNTEGNERSPFLCADGRIFFASDGRDGLGGLDIYEATPNADGYTVRNMGYPLNTRMDDFGLILDAASNTGYFTSNRPGGAGMDDIYSFRIKEVSKVPLNGMVFVLPEGALINARKPLAEAIVTIFDIARNVHIDQKHSDENGNFSVDVALESKYAFVATKDTLMADSLVVDLTNSNKKDQNIILTLQIPGVSPGTEVPSTEVPVTEVINTEKSDTAVTEHHFTEQRRKKEQVQRKKHTPNRLNVCIEVRDKDLDIPMVNATVYMVHTASRAIGTFVTDNQGRVCTQLEPDARYFIKAAQVHYMPDCMRLHISDTARGNLQASRPLMLEKLKLSQKLIYDEIFFDLDEFSIREDAAQELDKIVAFIKSHPGITVELSAHTDARGTSMYNEALSLKRAKSSKEYIILQGVDPDVITAKGYGEYMLTNRCNDGIPCTEGQHQQNRRTEIKITGIQETEQTTDTRLYLLQQKPDVNHDYSKECEASKLVPAVKWLSVEE